MPAAPCQAGTRCPAIAITCGCGPCTRRRPGVRHPSVTRRDSGQACLRHTERSAESCFLPDLTRFAGLCCAGPDRRRHAGAEWAAARASDGSSAPRTWIWGTGHQATACTVRGVIVRHASRVTGRVGRRRERRLVRVDRPRGSTPGTGVSGTAGTVGAWPSPVAVPEVPAAALLGAGRPGARRRRAAIVGARRTRRARVPLLGPARHRQDDDRAHPRQGAQLHDARRRRRARAASARTAVPIASGTFLDLFELDAASNRGIENIRDVIESVSLGLGPERAHQGVRPRRGAHAHGRRRRTRCLKTLEEAPGHVVFVLATTNPEKVLPTIRSRTQHFEFTLLSNEDLVGRLVGSLCAGRRRGRSRGARVIATGGARARRATRSRCSTRRWPTASTGSTPRRFASSSAAPRSTRACAILEAIAGEDAAGALVGLGELLESGHEPRRVAEDLLAAARDAFLLTAARGRVQRRPSRPTSRTSLRADR